MTFHFFSVSKIVIWSFQTIEKEYQESFGFERKRNLFHFEKHSSFVSVDRTFKPIWKREDLDAKCTELCRKLSEEMIEKSFEGKTITIKLKTTEFEQTTR